MRKLVLLAVVLAGCMSVSSEKIGPGVYAITAHGTGYKARRTKSEAYKEAYRLCPDGFIVRDGETESGIAEVGDTAVTTSCHGGYCSSNVRGPTRMAVGDTTLSIECD